MPIAVVLLHYNRWPNLRLALRALHEQTLPLSEFHVVVADDGSTDGTSDDMRRLARDPQWMGRLHFVSGGPHHGARISRIHNIGIANIPPECTFFVLISSDMCLAPDALEQIARLHQEHPQAVIITRLDWLPPMPHAQIEAIWNEQGFAGLCQSVPQQPMDWLGQTLVGSETRPLKATATLEPFDAYSLHPVYAVPTELYWRIGGYDEGMVGYGWQELEFAMRIQQADVSMITSQRIRAVHIWHPKDAEIDHLVRWQRQKNTAYLLNKHKPHVKALEYRDWSYWRHYHRSQAGRVVYVVDDTPSLYAVNDVNTHMLRLPHAGWLYPLGFSVADVEFVEASALASLTHAGSAEDKLNECDFTILASDLDSLLNQRLNSVSESRISDGSSDTHVELLRQRFTDYDRARTQSDLLPGANLPVIGLLIRILGRAALAGKVWSTERQLLDALLSTTEDLLRH